MLLTGLAKFGFVTPSRAAGGFDKLSAETDRGKDALAGLVALAVESELAWPFLGVSRLSLSCFAFTCFSTSCTAAFFGIKSQNEDALDSL